jgi:hypothetical protein
MWAELLRTRKMQSGHEAAVARIQLESGGCRIHVERASQEVHLFGDSASVEKAEQLLKELDQNCVEETFTLDTAQINSASLQILANSCGVTLQTHEYEVSILGLREHVQEAVDTLNEHWEDIESYLSFLEVSAPIGEEETEVKAPKKPAAVPIAQKTHKNPPQDSNKVAKGICPTCKACPFCPSCGHPTAFLYNGAMPGFAANGNNVVNMNSMNTYSDYNAEGGGFWVWQPAIPTMQQEFSIGDNMSQMAYAIPNAQNVPICFMPTTMVANRHP